MKRRSAIILVVGAVAWSTVAGGLVALILTRAPLVLDVGKAGLVLGKAGEIVALWALGAGVLLASALRRGWLRRVLWSVVVVGILLSTAIAVARLNPPTPKLVEARPGATVERQGRTTLLIGIDGMSWTAILPMVRRGELPNIERLMEQGSYGVLHSLRSYRKSVKEWGYWSPVVWTSLATGVRPQRHGITDFVTPGKGRIASSTDRKAPAFWNLFSAFGKRVGVVGWWATWPAEKVSGYLVSSHAGLRGWRARELARPHLTYPEDLADQLSLRGDTPESVVDWANREIFPFERYPVLQKTELKTIYSVLWQDRAYLRATQHLIQENDPVDLYAVYFEGIDALSHQFWKAYVDPDDADEITLPEGFRKHTRIIPTYYRVIDSYIGQLLDILPDDVTVLIVSDHGFRLDPKNAKGANHSPYGVLMARGEGIARGKSINLDPLGSLREAFDRHPTGVLDVLPTLLYLHGLPVAKDLDGEIVGSLFERRFVGAHPLLQVDSYGDFRKNREVEIKVDPNTAKEYEDRLRALGYIN